ncbi:hypothetical protein AMATHDRAFT_155816 [Amanita thiersii Skay4041]|uniref:FAD-binding PCMH-type domain-containing protein n=1 Tax=Amanita thiersii Skay4041 TaxID=703135 RepID=A0A2A9NF24_9AGAR|nr:hypothetical protein AMATHDRAFT_155816 [Amanita thiersii Skay4041]
MPGTSSYLNDNEHWAASSSQVSACSVEPGTTKDLGKILRILGESRTPFGVKSGGHATNPGFSSTPGVQIALFRFNRVTYHPESQTADIGSGLIFDDVYAQLAPYSVSVMGGRVSGIGVGGFLLGGGYSWHTNQRGLAMDTIVEYELVKPNGQVVTVNERSDSELFFGLKGIVTRFTMKTFPQGPVWGGIISYILPHISTATEAFIKFAANFTDPRASLIHSFAYYNGQPLLSVLLFYDDSKPPVGLFDDFLNIPSISSNVAERDYVSLIKSFPANQTSFTRGLFQGVPLIDSPPELVNTIYNESQTMGQEIFANSGVFLAHNIEPFLPTILSHAESPTAFPPSRTKAFYPFNIYYSWTDPTADDVMFEKARQSSARIWEAAIRGDPSIADGTIYPNYAIAGTTLENMYGGNVDRLKALKRRVDPNNVMGLAGGFKF